MSVSVSVASFNIRNSRAPDGRNHWWLRRRTTAAWIRRLDADVIALQEVLPAQRRYLARRFRGRRIVGRGRDRRGRGEQMSVLVRPPLEITAVEHRWFGDTPEVPGTKMDGANLPRVSTHARCRHVPSGAEFLVIDTHLDHRRDENRVRSVRQLVREVGPDLPVVLLGDLNARPGASDLFTVLADAGWRRLPYEGSSFNGWRHGTGHRLGAIDHIVLRDGRTGRWVRGDAALVSAAAGRLPSDHWPVRAELVLEPLDPR